MSVNIIIIIMVHYSSLETQEATNYMFSVFSTFANISLSIDNFMHNDYSQLNHLQLMLQIIYR